MTQHSSLVHRDDVQGTRGNGSMMIVLLWHCPFLKVSSKHDGFVSQHSEIWHSLPVHRALDSTALIVKPCEHLEASNVPSLHDGFPQHSPTLHFLPAQRNVGAGCFNSGPLVPPHSCCLKLEDKHDGFGSQHSAEVQ